MGMTLSHSTFGSSRDDTSFLQLRRNPDVVDRDDCGNLSLHVSKNIISSGAKGAIQLSGIFLSSEYFLTTLVFRL